MKVNFNIEEIHNMTTHCSTCDYRKLAEDAEHEVESLRDKLRTLKNLPLRPGEKILSRRRTVKLLTDMYYEQRKNLQLFRRRADEHPLHPENRVVMSLPLIQAVGKSRLF